ncbi:MAG: glycosyltransferase [Thermoanaerobaculia bacterium]
MYPIPETTAADDSLLVSVVIASVNGLPAIAECLQALLDQEASVRYEVIVVDRCGEATRAAIRGFPPSHVRLIAVDGTPSIPRLRAIGTAQARGRMVAVLEDHCNVAPGWLLAIEGAWRAGHQVVGGAVENGSTERLVDWAVFFCEYARFMPPLEGGVVTEITGNNSVYDRRLLARLGPELEDEACEARLHRRLREMGVELYCDPQLLVFHKKEFGFGYFLSQRFHTSRSFAGERLAGARRWKRWAYAGATPLLPPLLMSRIIAAVWRKRRHRAILLQALPLIGAFLIPWAWGEAVGALRGPGDSPSRVE